MLFGLAPSIFHPSPDWWKWYAEPIRGPSSVRRFRKAVMAHGTGFEFPLLAHILKMLLANKINSHISLNFCPKCQDGKWIIKALNAN